jgi:hypothetical protein
VPVHDSENTSYTPALHYITKESPRYATGYLCVNCREIMLQSIRQSSLLSYVNNERTYWTKVKKNINMCVEG